MRALLEVTSEMQRGRWELALELYTAAKTAWCELRTNHDLRSGPYRSLCSCLCVSQLPADCSSDILVVVQSAGGAARVPPQLHHRVGLHPDLIQRSGDFAEATPLRGALNSAQATRHMCL